MLLTFLQCSRFKLAIALLVFVCIQSALAADVLINPANQEPLDGERLKRMLSGNEKFWTSGHEVVIAVLKTEPDLDATLARYSGMTANKFRNHWQRIAFSGRGKMPKYFSDAAAFESFLLQNKGSIGIVTNEDPFAKLRRIEPSEPATAGQ